MRLGGDALAGVRGAEADVVVSAGVPVAPVAGLDLSAMAIGAALVAPVKAPAPVPVVPPMLELPIPVGTPGRLGMCGTTMERGAGCMTVGGD